MRPPFLASFAADIGEGGASRPAGAFLMPERSTMPDISAALLDPELGFLRFTVRRLTYRLSQGVASATHTDYPAEGCIHPGTPEMAQLLPEEERHRDFIAVYTSFPLSLGTNSGGAAWKAADRILYGGKAWKLVRLRDWSQFGYYQGLAALSDESVDRGTGVGG